MRIVSGITNFLKVRTKNFKRSSSGNWLRGERGLLCLRRLTVSAIHLNRVTYNYLLFSIMQPLNYTI